MVDHIVDASEPRGRVDIQVGAGRRRRWRDEVKGRIVAESYAPGAVVSEVARRHGISPQHLFVWRNSDGPTFLMAVAAVDSDGEQFRTTFPSICTVSERLGTPRGVSAPRAGHRDDTHPPTS